ncbi:hypothetical protein GCM10010492_50490 [Saccharothrix mutabilis subsp. mutabilis]|uniref:SH3b domain-containing protein n=1 Tax=Saccharothrix mutabilis subsp. mutabilis TaxID=66855 RepID=A0ABN0UBM1_9PSEU
MPAAVMAVLTLSGGTATAQAAPSTTDDVTVAAVCHYTITGDPVNIRLGAGEAYPVVRVKHRGDKVTGPWPCTSYAGNPRYLWYKLHLSTGGYGYVATHLAAYNGYW